MPNVLPNENLYTKFSTISLLTVKELRAPRAIPHAVLAEAVGKSPSAWSKIENGQAQLSINAMYGVCHRLNITPSYFFDLADRIAQYLSSNGWFISYQDNDQDDQLLPKMLNFYKSKGYGLIDHRKFISIDHLNSPYFYGRFNQPAALLYLTDEVFKKAMDSGDDAIHQYPKLAEYLPYDF